MNNINNISSIFTKFRVGIFSGLFLAAVLAFTGCATSDGAKPSATPTVHSETITLRAGDILKVSFPGSVTLDTTQQIRRDGKIVLPLVGEVEAAGLTPDALQQNLIKLYSSQLTSKEVIVTVESSSFPVFVTGAVIHPGKILSDHPITALEALMEAGGPDYNTANLKTVKISRNENGVMKSYVVNLKAVLDGDSSKTFYLKPEDIVYVPERFQMF
ncbi:MAG TPA: polysaccharide biosynthesis/export family protein [Verrucomicrobiae bacterium]